MCSIRPKWPRASIGSNGTRRDPAALRMCVTAAYGDKIEIVTGTIGLRESAVVCAGVCRPLLASFGLRAR